MNHELDAACARALGQEPQMRYCECDPESGVWGEVQYFEPPAIYIADRIQRGVGMLRPCVPRGTAGLWRVVPAYSEDCAAARELEDEIERRGLQKDYMSALADAADAMPFDTVLYPWHLLRATPEQRARAFVAAVRKGVANEQND